MTPELERRIRAVYPKGYQRLPDVSTCDFSYVAPLQATLKQRLARVGAGGNSLMAWSHAARVATVELGLCAADGIFWRTDGVPYTQHKQRLLETNAPGVVCGLAVSTVFPAWTCHFSEWFLRTDVAPGDPYAGHMRQRPVDKDNLPEAWAAILEEISASCALHGLQRLSPAELNETVPFVTECVWTKNPLSDDDLFDEVDMEDGNYRSSVQEACNVAQCLFESH